MTQMKYKLDEKYDQGFYMNEEEVFLVNGISQQPSKNAHEWVVGSFFNRQDAQTFVDRGNSLLKQLQDNHGKKDFDPYPILEEIYKLSNILGTAYFYLQTIPCIQEAKPLNENDIPYLPLSSNKSSQDRKSTSSCQRK